MSAQPAAGGGRWIDVPPERVQRWLAGFADRHGEVIVGREPYGECRVAADGTVAQCHVPFPPPVGDLIDHVLADRLVGVLLVRLGGHAAGVFAGAELVRSKVDSRLVHGRNQAGGQSQQRFARRRQGQVRLAHQAAADVAARVLLPYAGRLDAVVTGGERRATEAVLADRRLEPLRPLVQEQFLTVPDPRLAILKQTPESFRALRVRLLDPPDGRHT